MENASKAIIIAGGILIALVIISALALLFGEIGNVYKEEDDALIIKQLEENNRKFMTYNTIKGLYGSELMSLANLANEHNTKLLNDLDNNTNDKLYTDNKIEIEVKIYNIIVDSEVKDSLGNTIKRIFKKDTLKGTYNVESIRAYNNELMNLVENGNESAKSALTELRSLPFKCDTSKTTTNEEGRITYMYFEQVVDQNILNSGI